MGRGITLVELLLGLLLVLVLTTGSAPLLRVAQQEGRMVAAVNGFVHGLHVARQEASVRQATLVVCRSRTGRACEPAAPVDSGWLVFENRDDDQPPSLDRNEPILQVLPGLPSGSITSNRAVYQFRPRGRRSVNGTLLFCDRRGRAAARLVIVSVTGRPRSVLAREHHEVVTCPT